MYGRVNLPPRAMRFYCSIINETYRKHKPEIGQLALLNIFLDYMSNLFPNFYITRSGKEIEFVDWPSSGLVENVVCFTSYEFSAFIAELLSGVYDGAARTLRWILETAVKTYAGVSHQMKRVFHIVLYKKG